jgi:hypothetical protein
MAVAVVALFALALTTAPFAQANGHPGNGDGNGTENGNGADPGAPASGSSRGVEANIPALGIIVPPEPAVSCPPDSSGELVGFSEGDPALGSISIALLEVSCETDGDGTVTSTATATDGAITVTGLGTFGAETMTATCTANGDPSGSTDIVGLEGFGEEFEFTGDPNQELDLGLAVITFNRQVLTENADGSTTLRVDALYVDAGELGFASLSTVECTTSGGVAPPTTEPPPTTHVDPVLETTVPPPATPPADAPRAVVAQPTFTG